MKRFSFLLLLLSVFAFSDLVGQADTPPQALNLDEIRGKIGYPMGAKAARVDGKVIAKLVIDEKGKVAETTIMESPSELLSEAVLKKMAALKFKPAKQNGKAVRSIVHVPFLFELPKEQPVFTSLEKALAAGDEAVALDLSEQKLAKLDPRIATLKNLRNINLDGNRFAKFPTVLSKLLLLEEISIADNQLQSVPGSLKKLKNLRFLDLRGNDFSEETIIKVRERLESVSEVLAD